jgi:MoxR-like ATPase
VAPSTATIEGLTDALAERAYLADRGLATVLHVALALGKPLLLEGEAGVGKTEVAKTLADVLGARLIRLQCYEGIDVAHALYDWSYARQMLYIRTLEVAGGDAETIGRRALHDLFGPEFLVRRPLLDAIEHDDAVPPVLLVDEIDRADDEFEAFLLELLSDFQVTIPEIGTLHAERRPVVILTSNRTRELHDALKRRCLYHWIGHPSLEREIAIVRARVPGVPERLAAQAAAFVAQLRTLDLAKQPGVAETIDWTTALAALGEVELEAELVDATLGAVLKYHEDLERVRDRGLAELVEEARAS